MTPSAILAIFERVFVEQLQSKTGWGRKELIREVTRAKARALAIYAKNLEKLEAEGRKPTPVDLTYEEVTVHMNPPWKEATP